MIAVPSPQLSLFQDPHLRHDSLARQFLDDVRDNSELQGDPSSHPLRLLILDDDPAVADSLVIMLRRVGFQASAFYSDEDAISSARSTKYDILLADFWLGSKTGLEAVLQIRMLQPACRIFLLSGDEYAANKVLLSMGDVDEFRIIPKPVRCEELISLVTGAGSTEWARRYVSGIAPRHPRQVA